MNYVAVATKIEWDLKDIEKNCENLPSVTHKQKSENLLAGEKQPLFDRLDKVQNQVKQEEPYAKGTLAAGVLLVILITPILIALLAVFAPILSLPILLISIVLLPTAIIGGIASFAIGVQRLRENKDFLQRITTVRKQLNAIKAYSDPPPQTAEQEQKLKKFREDLKASQASQQV